MDVEVGKDSGWWMIPACQEWSEREKSRVDIVLYEKDSGETDLLAVCRGSKQASVLKNGRASLLKGYCVAGRFFLCPKLEIYA